MYVINSSVFRFSYLLLLFSLCLMLCLAGCSKNKFSCEANHSKNSYKPKKNKSRYGALYETKTRPVPKNYVVKNGR